MIQVRNNWEIEHFQKDYHVIHIRSSITIEKQRNYILLCMNFRYKNLKIRDRSFGIYEYPSTKLPLNLRIERNQWSYKQLWLFFIQAGLEKWHISSIIDDGIIGKRMWMEI